MAGPLNDWTYVTAPTASVPRPTPLLPAHLRHAATLADYAGWRLPIEFAGALREHHAVREHAGAFDVSHMGQIETTGPEAAALLQRLLSNDIERLAVGGAQYALLCRPDGGVLDDVFSYRLDDQRYLTVTNAANHAKDLAWFRRHAESFDVTVRDAAADYAMIAVQGPAARAIVAALSDGALPDRFAVAPLTVAGASALVCGTGYTGEDGVELLVAPADAESLWAALLARDVAPCGLAARDTLRLEACFHLYGNDLSEDRNPIEAGLGWCCREPTGFIGADRVAAARAAGTPERLVPFRLTGPGIPRPGHPVVEGGTVASGGFSPCLRAGIGLAYVPADRAAEGTALTVDVRGKHRPAVITRKPIYRPEGATA